MNTKTLRQEAAKLARDCRTIDRLGTWTLKEWNDSVRSTIRTYMANTARFHQAQGTWKETP
jgi:hypothetical protein